MSQTVLDGEVVALDEKGRPSFNTLQNHRPREPLHFFIFDLLILQGRNVMAEPLVKRRALIEKHVLPTSAHPIRYSPILEASLPNLIRSVKEQGLEGLVAKRRDSKYEPGERSGAFAKMRVNRAQDFVISIEREGPMTHRGLFAFLFPAALALVSTTPVCAQAPSKTPPSAKKWSVGRTSDGQPDLEGVWDAASMTPLERPVDLGNKEFYTPEEIAAYEQKRAHDLDRDRRDGSAEADLGRAYNDGWFDRGAHLASDRRTSRAIITCADKAPPIMRVKTASNVGTIISFGDAPEGVVSFDDLIARSLAAAYVAENSLRDSSRWSMDL